MAKFIQLFPLSVFRDKLTLSPSYKHELIDLILQMENTASLGNKPADSAWLGDTRGHEFLFQHPRFQDLYRQLGQRILAYTDALGLDNNFLHFCFQRSWATITRSAEQIHQHAHVNSHISFAYYLKKPQNSGGIYFITENHHNEMAPGLFSPAKQSSGLIKRPGLATWNRVLLEPDEDDLIIFPSKTLHATAPSQTDEPRISISADITLLLRDSSGHETLMPHFSNWRSFDELCVYEPATINSPV